MIKMRCVDLAREHEIQAEVDCCENSRIDQIHLDKLERKLSGKLAPNPFLGEDNVFFSLQVLESRLRSMVRRDLYFVRYRILQENGNDQPAGHHKRNIRNFNGQPLWCL